MQIIYILRFTTLALIILAVIAMVIEKQYDHLAKNASKQNKLSFLSKANLWSNISSALITISALVGIFSIANDVKFPQ